MTAAANAAQHFLGPPFGADLFIKMICLLVTVLNLMTLTMARLLAPRWMAPNGHQGDFEKGGKVNSVAQDAAEAAPASNTATEAVCNDNHEAVAQVRTTTAWPIGLGEPASACVGSGISSECTHSPWWKHYAG